MALWRSCPLIPNSYHALAIRRRRQRYQKETWPPETLGRTCSALSVKVRHRHFLPLQREINQIERSNPDDDDDDPCVVTRIFAGANEASDGGPRRFRCPRWEDISPPATSRGLIGSHCPQVDQGSWRNNWVQYICPWKSESDLQFFSVILSHMEAVDLINPHQGADLDANDRGRENLPFSGNQSPLVSALLPDL